MRKDQGHRYTSRFVSLCQSHATKTLHAKHSRWNPEKFYECLLERSRGIRMTETSQIGETREEKKDIFEIVLRQICKMSAGPTFLRFFISSSTTRYYLIAISDTFHLDYNICVCVCVCRKRRNMTNCRSVLSMAVRY